MIIEQIIVFLAILLALFLLLGRVVRYDLAALIVLLVIIFAGVVSPVDAFSGFTHPAVLIVLSMFVMTRALSESGIIEYITRKAGIANKHPIIQITILTILVAILSAFINNIGALAPLIPVAIHMARKSNVSPALFLLPLAFGSQLGGYLTLIGTPRNIIVSSFRERAGFEGFGMFDFALVGSGLAIIGIIFLSLIGWRFISKKKKDTSEEIFSIKNYITEVVIPKDSPLIGEYTKSVKEITKEAVKVLSLKRDNESIKDISGFEIIKGEDHLILQADPEDLSSLVESKKLKLAGNRAVEEETPDKEITSIETVVGKSSVMIGKVWDNISLAYRYGINLLAISRTGERINRSLKEIAFRPGDILILRGKRETINSAISDLGLYPLAEREISLGRTLTIPITLLIFTLTILTATFSKVPIELVFVTGAVMMILLNLVPLKKAYESIEWPILILIGSMLTLGFALEESGGAETIANLLVNNADVLSPAIILTIILILSILMANFISTNTAAVLMAPIAIFTATSLGLSIDPFLMAVAIGASSAYLTPYGHESNTLVMEAGGYTFKDYIKVGLPLELLIITASIPLILYFWPL